jgi:hypothetical protein
VDPLTRTSSGGFLGGSRAVLSCEFSTTKQGPVAVLDRKVMLVKRKTLLQRLVVGDIFHATTRNGASLICLVTRLNKTQIEARTVTTQKAVRVDRNTGLGKLGAERVACSVDSVAPLPIAVHNEMLGMDRKFRLAQSLKSLRLTSSEKKALLFIDSFYSERPI